MRASTEAYALLNARTIRETLGATWGLAETGASGPTGNRYGDAAGHACLAVAGPVSRAVTLETGETDREANMWTFAQAALDLAAGVPVRGGGGAGISARREAQGAGRIRAFSVLIHYFPLEGESARQGRSPPTRRWGVSAGCGCRAEKEISRPVSPHPNPPSSRVEGIGSKLNGNRYSAASSDIPFVVAQAPAGGTKISPRFSRPMSSASPARKSNAGNCSGAAQRICSKARLRKSPLKPVTW